MTATFPDSVADDRLTEIIDGVAVEKPPRSWLAGRLAFELARLLADFADRNESGKVDFENPFWVNSPNEPRRIRRPDVAFTSFERWPRGRELPAGGGPVDTVPDLAVEIISPTNAVEELNEKLRDYFAAGVRLVWVISPVARVAQQLRSFRDVRGVAEADSLLGDDVLPGFALPLSELWQRGV